MDDVLLCPICQNKLRNKKIGYKNLVGGSKAANYIERVCAKSMEHTIQLFTDGYTKKVDLLKISLNRRSSRILEVDFVNNKCRLHCMKMSKPDTIEIDKMLDLDFPDLKKLKEKLSIYVIFS
jgi:hypothetical protein